MEETTSIFWVNLGDRLRSAQRWKEQKFRANRGGSYVNVQSLSIYAILMCSFELLFVAKVITGRIPRKGMRWKLSWFMLFLFLVRNESSFLFKNWKRKESKKKMMKLWIVFVLKEKEHENKEGRMKTVNEMVF